MSNSSQNPSSTSPAVAPVPAAPLYRRNQKILCTKLVVAVHGMGDQTRNDMAQIVARLFARHAAKRAPSQATRLPMGLWDRGELSAEDYAIGFVSVDRSKWLEEFAFAEVYWADLPRQLEKEGFRLEESKRWASSVVERMDQRYALTGEFGENGPRLAAAVIEEIAETVRILERLLWLAGKAGLFNFGLGNILDTYIGDVQQVADFRGQRAKFLERFLERMEVLAAECPDAEIHIIAHSEGSVMAFLGLLTALWDESKYQPASPDQFDPKKHAAEHLFEIKERDMSWISRVRSFTTLGSPIDKHLILFPEMWYRFSSGKGSWRTFDQPDPPLIRWRNYYDLADPVGYELDTSKTQLKAWNCPFFEFEKDVHDHGFRRYPLPGKAHIDYFEDDDLFGHVIKSAVEGEQPIAGPPSRLRGRIARYLPFVLVVLIHLAAIFVLHQALVGVDRPTGTNSDDITKLPDTRTWETTMGLVGCFALLLGTTVVTRLWRMTRELPARIAGLVVFFVGAWLFWIWPGVYALEATSWFTAIVNTVAGANYPQEFIGRILFIGFALFVCVVSWLADIWQLNRKRSPLWGLRCMILVGGIPFCAILVIPRLFDPDTGNSWIMVLAGAAAFLYLWWLGVLIFDLAYSWARYISTTNSLLSRACRHRGELKTPHEAAAGADV